MMIAQKLLFALFGGLLMTLSTSARSEPVAPEPKLAYAFSMRIELAPPVEQGAIDGVRKRFIAITGGTISGPRLNGTVLAGGGDWQAIHPGGLTTIEARYFLKAADGTVIAITNPGVRTAAPEVIEKLARGEMVDPSSYYFRTSPKFDAPAGPHEWLNRQTFVARAIRMPDHVMIDVYSVE